MIRKPEDYLTGRALLENLADLEEHSTRSMRAAFDGDQMGWRAPRLLEHLGDGYACLGRMASCAWGCRGPAHLEENVLRRYVNALTAATSLNWKGYHDEALAVIRCAVELANLIQLFATDTEDWQRWCTLADRARFKEYGPLSVRIRLEEKGIAAIADKELYGALCELGVHLSPGATRLSHDLEEDRYHVGPHAAIPAFLLILGELVYCTGTSLPWAAEFVSLPRPDVEAMRARGVQMISDMPALRVTNYVAVMATMREQRDNEGPDHDG